MPRDVILACEVMYLLSHILGSEKSSHLSDLLPGPHKVRTVEKISVGQPRLATKRERVALKSTVESEEHRSR